MGIFDNLKRMTQPYDDGYDDYEDESADYERETRRPARAAEEAPAVEYSAPAAAPAAPASVSTFSGQLSGARGRNNVHLYFPESMDMKKAEEIVKMITSGTVVITNASKMGETDRQNMIYFLTGAVVAVNGTVKVLDEGQTNYVFCPHNVEISGDLKTDAE